MKSHYKILEVQENVTESEIKKAYHRLALKYHPDRNKSPDAEERFKKISAAHEVLSDPEKKKAYDRELHKAKPKESSSVHRKRQGYSSRDNDKKDEHFEKKWGSYNFYEGKKTSKKVEDYLFTVKNDIKNNDDLEKSFKDKVDADKWDDALNIISKGAIIDTRLSIMINDFSVMGTALHAALFRKKDNCYAKQLIISKADVNSTTSDGQTPLHIAALTDNLEMTDLLIEGGANTLFQTKKTRMTALQIAITSGSKDLALILMEKPFIDKRKNNHSYTIMDIAVKRALKDKSWWEVVDKLAESPKVELTYINCLDLLDKAGFSPKKTKDILNKICEEKAKNLCINLCAVI